MLSKTREDLMRSVIIYLRGAGWLLRKHLKAKTDGDAVGLDRFQFVRKDGAKTYANTRVWFVRSFITNREEMIKSMEEQYL